MKNSDKNHAGLMKVTPLSEQQANIIVIDVFTNQNINWLKRWDKICPLLKKKFSIIAEHYPLSTINRVVFVDELPDGCMVQNQGAQLAISIEFLNYALFNLSWLEHLDNLLIEAIVVNPASKQ